MRGFILRAEATRGRWRGVVSAFCIAALAAGCGAPPTSTATPPRATPSPTRPPASPTATALPLLTAPPTALPTRPELVVCLPEAPRSLYPYALPEASGNASRDLILAALTLPSQAPITATRQVNVVTVRAGDRVVDDLGRVVTLTTGVSVPLLDGGLATFDGVTALQVPQLTARFQVDAGLRWSDGQPLTADDSLLGFELAGQPEAFNLRRDRLDQTAAYRALDAHTVEWVGLPGLIDREVRARFWPPLPRHQYAGLSAAEIAASDQAGRAPLSLGPFRVQDWPPGEALTLERNPDFAGPAPARLERVTFRFVAAAQAVSDLAAGRCDVAPQLTAAEAAAFPALNLRAAVTTIEYSLSFGMAPAAGAAFFKDVRARQAVIDCLDQKAYTPPGPAERLYPDGLAPAPLDAAGARALLHELGWTEAGAGWVDPAGQPLQLILVGGPAGDAEIDRLLTVLPEQLKTNCGLSVTARALTVGELTADWPDGLLFGRHFDLAVTAFDLGQAAPCELWLSRQVADAADPAGVNFSGYQSPEFDAACRRAMTTLDDAEARAADAQAQGLLARDRPTLPLFFRLRLAAARPSVHGVGLEDGWDFAAVTVDP